MDSQPPTGRAMLAYQPALDGIRCFGLCGALCAHASVVQPLLIYPATYMFVDMFFVISGYLITTLVLRELHSTGRVSLKAFYVRRFARLYPVIVAALVAMITTTLLWPNSKATPGWLFITGAAFYFANFVAITNHADALSAWVSLWSLSIEEQFYAVWPAAMLWMMGKRRSVRKPLIVVGLLTLAMWSWRSYSIYQADHKPVSGLGEHVIVLSDAWHLFNFSTFYRPDGLLIGCAIALILSRAGSRPTTLLIATAHRLRYPALATIVIMTAVSNEPALWQVYWGLGLFNICIALIIVDLLHYPTSALSRVLCMRPFVWVGRRSYFVYVFHLAVFALTLDVLGLTTLPEIFATVAVIVALAGLSYRYYEDPIRRWGQGVSRRIIDPPKDSTEPARERSLPDQA